MPQIGWTLYGLAVGLGQAAIGTTIISSVVRYVAATALTTFIAKKSLKGNPSLLARNITSRGTVNPQAIVYGEAVLAGTLAYRNALGTANAELWAVHALCGHEVDDITDIYLDDREITDAQINGGSSAGGAVTAGFYGPLNGRDVVKVFKHLGTSTQVADANLVAADTFGDWTAASGSPLSGGHSLRGIAYIVTMFALWDTSEEEVWRKGDPTNVKAKVRGKKIYDPRLDSTQIIDSTTSPVTMGSGAHREDDSSTWAWSDTPALCVADYLMDSKFSPFPGGGIDPTRIDWESVAKAADDCETLVFVPPAASPQNTEKRFTCNGVLYASATAEQNLEALLSSMNGSLIFTGDKYVIRAGVYESPADSLDEDDIIGTIGIRSALDTEARINTMKARFIDPDKLYEPTETVAITVSAYKDTRDGGDELIDTIDLPMTNSWYMAQRIAIKRLHEANEELTVTVPCNLRAARLVPGERVNLTVTERGWAPKVFKVLDWTFTDRGGDEVGVNVTLREDQSSAYADPAVGEYNTLTNAVLTIGEPKPIPSVDSIPRGINFGVGTWSIELVKDSNDGIPDSNDGEIWFSAGRFILPDGTVRTFSGANLNTPYEGGTVPPDGRFYAVWGASDPRIRFGGSPIDSDFSSVTAAAAGLFIATYDRIEDQWRAVTDTGTLYDFTPADTDYAVATGTKTSASGGIDSLTALVAFENVPPIGNLMPLRYSDFEDMETSDVSGLSEGQAWSMSTNQSFTGSKALRYNDTGLNKTPTPTFKLSDPGQFENILHETNRRFLCIVRIYPVTAFAASATVDYTLFIGPTQTGGTTSFGGDELTQGQWNEVRWEIDYSDKTHRASFVQLSMSRSGFLGSPDTTPLDVYFDGIEFKDVTDRPELVEGVQ